MLLPDNIQPGNSVYYIGALVLNEMEHVNVINIGELYINMKKKYNMSFQLMMLSLDWLYLINAIIVNDKGEVQLCS